MRLGKWGKTGGRGKDGVQREDTPWVWRVLSRASGSGKTWVGEKGWGACSEKIPPGLGVRVEWCTRRSEGNLGGGGKIGCSEKTPPGFGGLSRALKGGGRFEGGKNGVR